MNCKDISIENIKLKVLVYGQSGTGKTYFAGTFPKPYFFDFDNGMKTLRGKDIEYDTYADVLRNGIAVESAIQKYEAKLNQVIVDHKFDTLVIDSVTLLEDMMMANILRVNGRKEPTLYEWGLLISHMQQVFQSFTKSGKHVVCIAHEIPQKNDITGEVTILPLISGKKLPGQLPIWFDEVYRAVVTKDSQGIPKYELITRAGAMYTAKSRVGCLAEREVPSFEVIMNKVKMGK